ncbi:uncharacterized protein [Haliotis asinina]|uniref:uncharacterized protein n=1 Tax=Haliotis asinina TaxID=109174 RepID=UPI0035322425
MVEVVVAERVRRLTLCAGDEVSDSEGYVEEQLITALPEKSLVVMDNASYHNCREFDNRCPTSNCRKAEIIEWLDRNNIVRPDKATKQVLYELVLLHKPPPSYAIDKMFKNAGHEVPRLPPYHFDLNPIELIWEDIKGKVSRYNTTFKLSEVEKIVRTAIGEVDISRRETCVKHVLAVENEYWKLDGIREETIPPILIHLGDESNTERRRDAL